MKLNHWANLGRAKSKRKKEFNLEACEKVTSNNRLKKNNNEKALPPNPFTTNVKGTYIAKKYK